MDFIDRSTKVMERALDEQYDLLTDYASGGLVDADDDDDDGRGTAKSSRRIKQVAQFWDERWSKKRIIRIRSRSDWRRKIIFKFFSII